MLTFKEFLNEDDSPVLSTQREVKANLDDPCTIDELNRFLIQVTGQRFNSPYSALLAVSKVLSTYGVVLPQLSYMPEPCGEQFFEIEQWGMHPGYAHNFNDTKDGIQTNPGIVPYQNVRSAPETNNEVLYVYLCWDMNEDGVYDAFCMVIDKEGLDTILATEEVNEDADSDAIAAYLAKKGAAKVPEGQRTMSGYEMRKHVRGQEVKPRTKELAPAERFADRSYWAGASRVREDVNEAKKPKSLAVDSQQHIAKTFKFGQPIKKSAKDNDSVFKNWRKEVGTDYQTTKNIVEK